ncbi:MAG: hypothetical protein AAB657_03980 [Patescibacteria group bacterium]
MLKSLTQNILPIVPDNFVVPTSKDFANFKLEILNKNHLLLDYKAVMESIKKIKGVFGSYEPNWPSNDLTLEDDLSDLNWHYQEFERRTSFTYTVLSLDNLQCLGCVYIFPSDKKEYGTIVFLWVNSNGILTTQDLYKNIKDWLTSSWPFSKIGYPGIEINWNEWDALPNKTS